jgi:hypothetical protein
MDGTGDDATTQRISDALKPLISNDAVRVRIASDIDATIAFLNWKPPPDSEFLNFTGKVNIVVSHFAADSLGREPYLRALIKQPSLFTLKPTTIIKNIDEVVDHFAADGLTRQDYLRAAIRLPQLFHQKSRTVINNIENVVHHFAADGMTNSSYLRAARTYPQLFAQKPKTLIGNIEEVTNYFAADGLIRKDYLRATLKQPQLFVQKPKTVIGHVNLLTALCNEGVLTVYKTMDNTPVRATVLRFMINTPQYFALADDNFTLREIYGRVTDAPPSSALLRKSRRQVENELAKVLGHADLQEPVPKLERDDGQGQHARNLLLRALIREGTVRGELS